MSFATRSALILMAGLAWAPIAHSTVISGTFTGTITHSFDRGGVVFGGAEDDGQVGLSVTGSFSADLSLAPPQVPDDFGRVTLFESLFGEAPWVTMTFTISGIDFDVDLGGNASFDEIRFDATDAGFLSYDGYGAGRSMNGTIPSTGFFAQRALSLSFIDEIQTELVEGQTVAQTFTWHDVNGNDPGSAGNGSYESSEFDRGANEFAYEIIGEFRLDSLTVRASPVPAPPAIALLTSALLSMLRLGHGRFPARRPVKSRIAGQA